MIEKLGKCTDGRTINKETVGLLTKDYILFKDSIFTSSSHSKNCSWLLGRGIKVKVTVIYFEGGMLFVLPGNTNIIALREAI